MFDLIRIFSAEMMGHWNDIEGYCLSNDRTTLATKSNNYDNNTWNIRVWNLERHELTHNIEGNIDSVECLAFTNNGRKLIAGFYFANVKIWDLNPNGIAELSTTLNCWKIAEDPEKYQSKYDVNWDYGTNINKYIGTFFDDVDKINIGHIFASNTQKLIVSDDECYLTAINLKNEYNKKWDLRTYQEVSLDSIIIS